MTQDLNSLLVDIGGVIGSISPGGSSAMAAATYDSWIANSSAQLQAVASQIVVDAQWDLARDLGVQAQKQLVSGTMTIGSALLPAVAGQTTGRPAGMISPEYLELVQTLSPITGLTITNAGRGYTTPPTWTASNGATFACVIDAAGRVIDLVMLTQGTSVASAPTLTATAPPAGGTTATATATITLATKQLELQSRGWLREYWPAPALTGEPLYYSIYDGTNIFLAPTPDLAYAFNFQFKGLPPPLSSTSITNVFTVYFYQTLRARCLYYASLYQLDWDGKASQVAGWAKTYADLVASARDADVRAARDEFQQPFWPTENRPKSAAPQTAMAGAA